MKKYDHERFLLKNESFKNVIIHCNMLVLCVIHFKLTLSSIPTNTDAHNVMSLK